MPQRFAIYYAPSTSDPLWDRSAAWLGRDAASNELFDGNVAGIDRTRLLNLTQSASRYGFHATLKPPMALAAGATIEDLQAAMSEFAAVAQPVELGRLRLASIDGFLALVPENEDNLVLQDFAAHVVEGFEPFRAPLSPREFQARLAKGLTPRQEELLEAYGYPFVFDEFRFHMTLTDRLDDEDREELMSAAQTWFGPVLDAPVVLDRVVLFAEPDNGLPFVRLGEYRLGA
jgi:putative phosphonate metabolism protein